MFSEVNLFADFSVKLTAHLIQHVENRIRMKGSHVVKEFHKGNDQINYGYTDKGLNKANSKDMINFNEDGTQLSYIYRFFPGHVLILGELLLSASGWNGVRYRIPPKVCNLRMVNEFLDELSRSANVTVTCFGGGPGAELAAIISWLRIEGLHNQIRFNIVDKYSAWCDVAEQVAQCSSSLIHYQELDFLSATQPQLMSYVSTMDIIVMSKFLSALTAHRAKATQNLREVLRMMRPGALLVYLDNSGGGSTEWVTREAEANGLLEVFSVKHYPAHINPQVLAPNEKHQLFNVKATSTLNVAFKMFRKAGPTPAAPGWDPYSSCRTFYRNKDYIRAGVSHTSV